MDLELVTAVDAENPVVGDLKLVNGQIQWIGQNEDTDAVDHALATAQRLRCRLQTIQGTWYQDNRIGLPYWTVIWTKGPNLGRIRSVYSKAILGTVGVEYLESLEVTLDRTTRKLSVAFVAVTTKGQRIRAADLDEPFIVEE